MNKCKWEKQPIYLFEKVTPMFSFLFNSKVLLY